jgi:outer membrane protein OmpA-like peptidoglycan-associated protein
VAGSACTQEQLAGSADHFVEKGGEQIGIYDDPGGHHIIVIHQGMAEYGTLVDDIELAVTDAADDGAQLDVVVVGGANAATAVDVPLPDGGDLRLQSANDTTRERERQGHVDATMEAVGLVLGTAPERAPGAADLFGAVDDAFNEVSGASPAKVTLITGGGVHRTGKVDLMTAYDNGVAASEIVGALPTLSDVAGGSNPWILVDVRGVGQFAGTDPAPAIDFTELLDETWGHWCAGQSHAVASCRVNGVEQRAHVTDHGVDEPSASQVDPDLLVSPEALDDLASEGLPAGTVGARELPVAVLGSRTIDAADVGGTPGDLVDCEVLVVGDAGLDEVGAVTFEANELVLTAEAADELDRLIAPLLGPGVLVHAIGHADRRPSPVGNDVLALGRAEAVADHLAALGTDATISFEGRGSSELIDLGGSQAAHAANRRVEVFVCVPTHRSSTLRQDPGAEGQVQS